MYLLYADESGDIGRNNSPTRFFCLSGLVVHELCWNDTLEAIINFRRRLRQVYGLKLREEIHAAAFIQKPGEMRRIPKSMRLRLLRDTLEFQASLINVNIINVVVDKAKPARANDVFKIAWQTLIQRFHNTLFRNNFPGTPNPKDQGMLIVDQTDEVKLRNLSRRMRRYNPTPSLSGGFCHVPTDMIVEDAVHRNSLHSYFIQLADVNAYFLQQKYDPCGYIKTKGGRNFFNRLAPVLCKVASSAHPLGIVER